MGTKIKTFDNPEFGNVRTVLKEDGTLLFVASDVAKSLGYAVPQKAVIDHCKHCSKMEHPSNKGTYINLIPESDMYRLTMKSKLPSAEKFQDWICEEVIPSIRKHGAYATETTIDSIIANPENGIRLLQALQQEREEKRQLEADNEAKQREIDAARPAVTFTSAVSGAESSCLIGELAKIIAQNGVEIGEKRLFQWLRDNGYLGRHGERYNVPNQKYIEQGLFTVKKGVRSSSGGVLHTTLTPKITGKGQVYFVNKFLNSVAL